MFNLLLFELRRRRNAIIGWSIGLGLYALYTISLYPAMGEQYADLIQNLDMNNPVFQVFGDFANLTSFSGFFSLYIADYMPLVLAIYAITNGTGALAGEEEEGTLELILSMPLRRWQIVVAKVLAMMIAIFLILLVAGAIGAASFMAYEPQLGDTNVTDGELLAMMLYAWPVVMLFMMLSLFLGAYLPRRRTAAMLVTLYLVASFFGNNLAAMSDVLETLQPLFPFYYYDGVAILAEGIPAGHLFTLLAAVAILLGLAVVSFQRRDVTVGAWPWQRADFPFQGRFRISDKWLDDAKQSGRP